MKRCLFVSILLYVILSSSYSSAQRMDGVDISVIPGTSVSPNLWSATGISVDQSDSQSVYISGTASSGFQGLTSNGGMDYFVIKVSLNGTIVWKRMYGDFRNQNNRGGHVVDSQTGDLIISGYAPDANADEKFYILSYRIRASNGSIVWTLNTNGSSIEFLTYSRSIIVSNTILIYPVAAKSSSGRYAGRTLTTNNFDCAFLSVHLTNGTAFALSGAFGTTDFDAPYTAAVSGNFIFSGGEARLDAYIVAHHLSNFSVSVPMQIFGGSLMDYTNAVLVSSDSVYFGGRITGAVLNQSMMNPGVDMFISRWDTALNRQWFRIYGATSDDTLSALVQDPLNPDVIYAVGSLFGQINGTNLQAQNTALLMNPNFDLMMADNVSPVGWLTNSYFVDMCGGYCFDDINPAIQTRLDFLCFGMGSSVTVFQTVELAPAGVSQVEIEYRIKRTGISNCPFYVNLQLLDANNNVITSIRDPAVGTLNLISLLPPNPNIDGEFIIRRMSINRTNVTNFDAIRRARVTLFGSQDPYAWAGHYGPRFEYVSLNVQSSFTPLGGRDAALVAFHPNGTFYWTKRFGSYSTDTASGATFNTGRLLMVGMMNNELALFQYNNASSAIEQVFTSSLSPSRTTSKIVTNTRVTTSTLVILPTGNPADTDDMNGSLSLRISVAWLVVVICATSLLSLLTYVLFEWRTRRRLCNTNAESYSAIEIQHQNIVTRVNTGGSSHYNNSSSYSRPHSDELSKPPMRTALSFASNTGYLKHILDLPAMNNLADYTSHTTTIANTDGKKVLTAPGHYQVDVANLMPVKQIFSNSNCDVYCCTTLDEELAKRSRNRILAVKYLKSKSATTNDSFFQEISIMYYFQGRPNFVQLLGFCTEPLTIITDLYSMGNLADCLYNKRLIVSNRRVILRFALQISIALCEMHSNDFSHSDLKPHNVFVDRRNGEYFCLLGDFGLARVLDESNLAVKAYKVMNTKGLTVRYAAPEMLRMHRNIIVERELNAEFFLKADIYSLALMLFELAINDAVRWK